MPIPKNDPRYIEALWQLHKEKGGGYHHEEEIQARAESILPKLPPLPLPPLPLPPLPKLPPLPLPPLPRIPS